MEIRTRNTWEFDGIIPKTYTFKKGWGVFVSCIYDLNDHSTRSMAKDHISDIEVSIYEISPLWIALIGQVPCVANPLRGGEYIPVENFKEVSDLTVDDSHDLRTRWFATKKEAENHAQSVRDLWKNPNPWTAFCVTE